MATAVVLARCSAPERVWSAAATAPAAQCSSVCFAASAGGPPCLLLLHAPLPCTSGAPNRRELWASEEPPPEGEGSSSPGLLVTPHDETATHQRLPDQTAAKDGVHFVTAGRDPAEQPHGTVVLGVQIGRA